MAIFHYQRSARSKALPFIEYENCANAACEPDEKRNRVQEFIKRIQSVRRTYLLSLSSNN